MARNINSSVDDAFYRYKMPRLVAKVEGKGNGIKTVIANMPEIAKALNRPPMYPTKYFGCELGAQTQFDQKNDRYIVNGEHDREKLETLLDGFIKKFVLCPECDNPETTLTVRKQIIQQSCKACGYSGTIDPRHKLTTYIVKNPPVEESVATVDASTNAAAADKKQRRTKRKDGGSPNGDSPTTPNGEIEAPPLEPSGDTVAEECWSVDPEAAEERLRELAGGMSGLTMNTDMEKPAQERLDMLFNFLKAEKEKTKGQVDAKKIVAEADRLDLKEKAPLLCCNVLFDTNIVQQIRIYRPIFYRLCYGSQRAQKYLLGGLEQLIATDKAKFLPLVPHILKGLYDEDIVEEDVILEWGAKASKKYVDKELSKAIRQQAEPFLKWLKEAEVESDESEDDGVEVVYAENNGPASAAKPKAAVSGSANGTAVSQNGHAPDDDLDIDDI